MPADSSARRLLKQALAPVLNEHTYRWLQAAAKAWDIRRGSWTEPEIAFLRDAVRPGDTVIDVGANYGLYCYHLSRAVGRAGRVYAFEPVPFTCRTARLVIRLLGLHNVTLSEQGCGDRAGTVTFTIPVQRSGAISAGQAHVAGRNDERQGKEVYAPFERNQEIPCQVVRLDEALREAPPVSFIKSDIEGADLLGLRGAEGIIDRDHPTIMTEIKAWFLEGFGIRAEAFGDLLYPKGYELFHFEARDGRRALQPSSLEALGDFPSDNYIFIHESRRAQFAGLLAAGSRRPAAAAVGT